ncbi:MAG: hypothetical protein CME64_13025 [Halobacteriovoraceae bacterium]|nr:hypothetical protein [Halobacteriovoraceae bacterium]|tara:strand:+ start:88375 stop:88779 length:405 start_codon:yes stop_codon:yes gene_type:complete
MHIESLLVLSKVKKYIKEKYGCSTSANFFLPLNKDVGENLDQAIERAKNAGRKTVMGKDFSFYVENPEVEDNLVVASKVKRYIKDRDGLSTSSQAFAQLSSRVQKICDASAQKALDAKRKTVMDRDFTPPTTSL